MYLTGHGVNKCDNMFPLLDYSLITFNDNGLISKIEFDHAPGSLPNVGVPHPLFA